MNNWSCSLGWSDLWQRRSKRLQKVTGWLPARVINVEKQNYRIYWLDRAEISLAVVSGKLYHKATGPEDLPIVGDWVLVDDSQEHPIIAAILERTSLFCRKMVGKSTLRQPISANINYIFIVTECLQDFNTNRLQRYLTLTQYSQAQPVIIFNKIDLVDTTQKTHCYQLVQSLIAPEFIISMSAINMTKADILEQLKPYLKRGTTITFVGSSGVGKSTLINLLLNDACQKTNTVNTLTQKGKHTTTQRQLLVTTNGICLIDNPGMREIQMWSDAEMLRQQFADIQALAEQCLFRDCQHKNDKGCAIQQALQQQHISDEHYQNFLKLDAEILQLEKDKKERYRAYQRIAKRQKYHQVRNYNDRQVLDKELNPNRYKAFFSAAENNNH